MVRLELGIPAELVELGMVLGAELTRAQYLALLDNGITSPDEVGVSNVENLANWLNVSEAKVIELQALLQRRERRSEESFAPLLPPPTE
jgi:ATP-dependent DNA helicase